MTGYSYVVARDYGFAPNPFGGICSLATCKPGIRRAAQTGDWVFGTGSATRGQRGHLVFAMNVDEKLSFNQYWNDPRFRYKRPVMNGSLKKMYGDNIYFHDGMNWIQSDSHHSLEDGTVNSRNLKTDTSSDAVLLASDFYYLGCQPTPTALSDYVVKTGPGHRNVYSPILDDFVRWIRKTHQPGITAEPSQFAIFQRFRGP